MKKFFLLLIFLNMTCSSFAQTDQPERTGVQTKAGSALTFDGIDDIVTIGNFTSLYVNTVEGWIKPAGDETGAVFANGGGPKAACTQGVMLTISRQELCYDVNPANCGTDHDVCYSADLIGQWTHFAGTFDGDTAKLYINGKLEKTVSGLSFNSGDWLTLGGLQFFNGIQSYYKGELDELRVWNVARSEEEIRTNMNRTLTGNEPGLVAYWKFDEGKDQNVNETIFGQFDGLLGTNEEIQSTDPRWTPSEAPLTCQADNCQDQETPNAPKEFLKWSFNYNVFGFVRTESLLVGRIKICSRA